MILWTITFELRMILQNISRRVVGNVLINISPSNILPIMLKPVNFHQHCQAGFGRCEYLWVKVACGVNYSTQVFQFLFENDEKRIFTTFLSSHNLNN